jgi:DNA-binding GntR family transcriptional regulator
MKTKATKKSTKSAGSRATTAPMFTHVRPESTRDKVYQAVRDAILTGRLQPGDRITESVLASEFGVSRAVIREALQQLSYEGLVEQNSYKGTRVIQLSPAQIDEQLAARLLLETEIVQQAQEKLTDDDKKQLKAMARQLESVVNNPQLYAELDLQLHRRIWELSGNPTFQKLLEQVTTPLFAMGVIMRYSSAYSTNGKSVKAARPSDHVRLIEAICDGTRDAAQQAIREHVTHNWRMTREKAEELVNTQETKRRPRRAS